jgi:hypothetical protein
MTLPGIPIARQLRIRIPAVGLQGKHRYGVDRSASLWSDGVTCIKRRQEPITPARQSLDKTGSFRGIAQRFPQLVDGLVEAVIEIDKGVSGPEPASKFFARYDLRRISTNIARI